MTVRRDGDLIRLEGDCHVEDAEALVALLDADPTLGVELSACRHLQGAVLQALLYYRPPVAGTPADTFLREWVLPNVAMARARIETPPDDH